MPPFLFSIPGFKNGSITLMTIVRNRKISFTESISISIWHKNDNRPTSSYRWSDEKRRLGGVSLGRVHENTTYYGESCGLLFSTTLRNKATATTVKSGAFNWAVSSFLTAGVHLIHIGTSWMACAESLMQLIFFSYKMFSCSKLFTSPSGPHIGETNLTCVYTE